MAFFTQTILQHGNESQFMNSVHCFYVFTFRERSEKVNMKATAVFKK